MTILVYFVIFSITVTIYRFGCVRQNVRLKCIRTNCIPLVFILGPACLLLRSCIYNLNVDIHGSCIRLINLCYPYALHRITNLEPFRQRPHRHQIDEHQRRHQNGYKAFYFIPHCLILLFHLEAALPMLPERSKRICGQTVRRLKKKISEKRARHSCAACSVGSVFQPKTSALTRQ